MRCPSCAEEIASSSRFCPFCGHAVHASRDEGDGTEDAGATSAGDPDATTRMDPADPDATTRIDTGPVTGPTRECPRCGATNSAQRATCGRCEADIETGSLSHRGVLPDPGLEQEDGEERGGGGRRLAVVLVVIAALVGVGLGLAAWLGTDDPPSGAQPVFDAGVYPEDPSPLPVAEVTASSTGEIDGEPVGAGHLFDDDRSTAWAAEGGVGESIVVRFTGAVWIGEVSVWNGAQTDVERFEAYPRALRLVARSEEGTTLEVALADVDGEQAAVLPEPVLVRALTIEIDEVAGGEEGVALSGLQFRGWEARGADRTR